VTSVEREPDERALEFQAKVRRKVGPRYSEELRTEAVTYAEEAIRKGASRANVAAVLGLDPSTLYRWLWQMAAGQPAGESMEGEGGRRSAVSLVTPDGYRVEGLTLAEVSMLLEELR
jgi:transposase-like protein